MRPPLLPATLRGAALLPAAALAVHQLRYALAHGDGAGQALAAEGHAYLSSAAPWLVLLATLSLGASLGRLAQRWSAHPTQTPRSTARVWLLASLALVATYAGQELIEGALAPGHAAGLAGVFGAGGWWALPVSVALGGLLALVLRGTEAVAADFGALRLPATSLRRSRRASCAPARPSSPPALPSPRRPPGAHRRARSRPHPPESPPSRRAARPTSRGAHMRITTHRLPAALAAAGLALAAASAAAHEGDPRYRSTVEAIVPATEGLSARVLDHDDALELTNRSGKDVVVLGEDGRPWIRLRADGAVQVDRAAEETEEEHAGAGWKLASYQLAHEGHEHEEPAPAGGRAIHWATLDRTGRYAWHDARIRWTGAGLPPEVVDESRETRISAWRVPIRVGDRPGAIQGTLTWVGEPAAEGGFPTGAAVSLGAIALLVLAAVALVRRRRRAG